MPVLMRMTGSRYMSPEAWRGDGSASLSPGTDIWSVGVCLFKLVAGRAPFLPDVDALGTSDSRHIIAKVRQHGGSLRRRGDD
jgi:serine/threonine protein kinase